MRDVTEWWTFVPQIILHLEQNTRVSLKWGEKSKCLVSDWVRSSPVLKMDSGWAQFRVLYSFEPRDRRDIAIQKGDIVIVAKPVLDCSDWLTGENRRTGEVGEFPGTYVEYIGDIEVLPQEENIDKPPVPPPRPPRTSTRPQGLWLIS